MRKEGGRGRYGILNTRLPGYLIEYNQVNNSLHMHTSSFNVLQKRIANSEEGADGGALRADKASVTPTKDI